VQKSGEKTEAIIQVEMEDHQSKKWGHLRKILERSGPFDTANFAPSKDNLEFLMTNCKILVIGNYTFVS